jgi:hypothetical protein
MKKSKLFQLCAYEIEYKQIGDSVNYAFMEEKKTKTLYIFFQGSNSITDWVLNFWFTKKVYKMFRVHNGFFHAYSQARNMLLDKVYEKDENGDYKWLKIIIVGYSHGGALAQLLLQDVWYHRQDIKDCVLAYAFETPRCLKVPKKYRFMWENLTTIRTNNDLITHLPPRLFGFNDLGKMLKVKGDVSLVKNHLPKCIKSHYPQVVLDGLMNDEKKSHED